MNTGTSFHICHDNVKFEVRKYVRLSQDKYEFKFQNDGYTLEISIEKTPGATWNDVVQRNYGKKTLRFTHRTNGQTGLWLVVRFPQQTILEKAKCNGSIWRTVSANELTYSFTITFYPSIIEQIRSRTQERSQQMRAKREMQKADERKPIEYICQNPKPYQGGGFSSK